MIPSVLPDTIGRWLTDLSRTWEGDPKLAKMMRSHYLF